MTRLLTPAVFAWAVMAAAATGPDRTLREQIERADAAFRAGLWAEARAEYEGILAARTGPSKTLREQIARCYSHEREYDRALEHLQTLLDADPGDDGLRLWMAREELKAGRIDRGRALFATVDSAAITDPGVYFDFAALLIIQFRPEDAILYLTRAIALDGGFLDGYFRRGLAYLQLHRLAEARHDLRKVVELAPDSPQAVTARKALEQLR